ncbi:MAG: hypothetical protein ACLS3M_11820 [Collinsella sp.]
MALDRAKAYYRQRLANEKPLGEGPEKQADSAARKAFFAYASEEVERAYIAEEDGKVSAYIPFLPRNPDEARTTELYTDVRWPTSELDEVSYRITGLTVKLQRGTPGGWRLSRFLTVTKRVANAISVCRL